MKFNLDKYGNGVILFVLLLVCFVGYHYYSYISQKYPDVGVSLMSSNMNPAYMNTTDASPLNSTSSSTIDTYASASGIQSSIIQPSGSCSTQPIQNPSELLPNTDNTQWSALNPNGKGELSNINLLKSGYHAGIDTIGTSLRNANLQLRSEPPNPQVYSGPWNMSTITPDFVRPAFEIGAGSQ